MHSRYTFKTPFLIQRLFVPDGYATLVIMILVGDYPSFLYGIRENNENAFILKSGKRSLHTSIVVLLLHCLLSNTTTKPRNLVNSIFYSPMALTLFFVNLFPYVLNFLSGVFSHCY